MNSEIKNNVKSPFAIFLDIQGVVYGGLIEYIVAEKVKELFPNQKHDNSNMSNIAAAHYFDKKALENLDLLISKIEEVYQVQIIISSNWRLFQSVEELKTSIFGIHSFSKYIVDKIIDHLPQDEIKNYCNHSSHIPESPASCKAAEIQHWLKNHPEVTNYVIFGDMDLHLSCTFKEHYIKTTWRTLLTHELVLNALELINH